MTKIVSEAVQRDMGQFSKRANRYKGNVTYQHTANMKHRRLETAASKWNWTSTSIRCCSIARLYWEVTLFSNCLWNYLMPDAISFFFVLCLQFAKNSKLIVLVPDHCLFVWFKIIKTNILKISRKKWGSQAVCIFYQFICLKVWWSDLHCLIMTLNLRLE